MSRVVPSMTLEQRRALIERAFAFLQLDSAALHRQSRAESKRRWALAAYSANPQVRINARLASAFRRAIRGGTLGRWEADLGYTTPELMQTLKRLVPKGFVWGDLLCGHLHVDHVTPKSRFDVSTSDGLRAAWSLGNLQLLPALENLRKAAQQRTLL